MQNNEGFSRQNAKNPAAGGAHRVSSDVGIGYLAGSVSNDFNLTRTSFTSAQSPTIIKADHTMYATRNPTEVGVIAGMVDYRAVVMWE
ncbi:hypothetical protein BC2230_11661 [Burkholderia cepacia]